MPATAVLDPPIQDTLFGEPRAVKMESPEPTETCFCTCACRSQLVKITNVDLSSSGNWATMPPA